MSTGNLNLDLFLNELLESSIIAGDKAYSAIRQRYPSLSEKEASEISKMILSLSYQQPKELVSLVVTAPPSFSIRAKSTKNTIDSMIKNAQKSILITGYSLSDYFNELVDTIILKSQSGVFVEFFFNNIEAQQYADKLVRYKGHFLRIYNYFPNNDALSALHAKVLSVDGKDTLITSANLSYHGQEGNIELGTIIESDMFAKQVKDVFVQLVFKKVFVEL